jgi:hypothetical protein
MTKLIVAFLSFAKTPKKVENENECMNFEIPILCQILARL